MGEKIQMTQKDFEATVDEKVEKSVGAFKDELDGIKETITESVKDMVKPIEKRIGRIEVKENEVEGGGGFNSAEEYWTAAVTVVKSKGAVVDDRFKAAGTGLVTAQGPDGGLTVAPAWSADLLNKLHEDLNVFANRCWNMPMGGGLLEMPMFNDTNRSNGVAGGIQVYWADELAQYTSSKTANNEISLKLKKATALVYLSDEMISDSAVSIKPLISRAVNEGFKEKFNDSIINGTGAKDPRGIMSDPAIIEVAIESGQTSDTPFVPENIFKMRSRSSNYSNSVWVAGPDAYPYLRTLALPIGTGGALMPLFDGNNLDGRPIIFCDYMQSVNTAGDLMLIDFNDYIWATKAGESIATAASIHLKFDYGQEALRFTARVDGQGWRTAPYTPRNNGATRSPFIRLGTRS